MERAKWLDGLRGIASVIVAFDHLFMDEVTHPFHSYWTHPPSKNQHWIQLPPFRILFSANAMAALFFVISGYAIALNLLRARNNYSSQQQQQPQKHQQNEDHHHHHQSFYSRVSSAATRRLFRLYLPVLVITTVSQFLYFVNLYHWKFDADVTIKRGIAPWTAPWQHLCYLVGYMADLMNPVVLQYNEGLNRQLWTMPVILRGSALVYLLIMATASWRSRPRLIALAALSTYFLWFGMWDVFAFVAGLWLAEIQVSEESGLDEDGEKDDELSLLPSSSPSSSSSTSTSPSPSSSWSSPSATTRLLRRRLILPFRIMNIFLFLLGFYLLCLPDDHFIPHGYRFLLRFQPTEWTTSNTKTLSSSIAQFSWKSVGAALTLYSISNMPAMQHVLANSGILQYLGRISFSLGLVHQTVYQLFREPLKRHVWRSLAGYQYPGAHLADRDPFAWLLTWLLALMVFAPVLVFVADEFARYVEVRCLAMTREIEKWLARK